MSWVKSDSGQVSQPLYITWTGRKGTYHLLIGLKNVGKYLTQSLSYQAELGWSQVDWSNSKYKLK